MSMVEKQNKRLKSTGSATYGSLTFWKNRDFWESMLLYVICLALFFTLGYIANLMQ